MAEALYLLIRFVLSRYIEKGVDLVHQLMHTYEESEFCLLFKASIQSIRDIAGRYARGLGDLEGG